ncbi:MAG TPA: Xaa-Pro peptidase family protein [Fimbriimonas sp.]|nr:Xaa-Pro peptidase family protein [Fimbriimonas sp.]
MDALGKLRAAMGEHGIAALLVSDISNVTWLTGFTGTYGRVLVTEDKGLFITDSRYTVQAAEQVTSMPTVSFASPVDGDSFLAIHVGAFGISKLAFEGASVTYAAYEKLSEKLEGVELVSAPDLISRLRMVKGGDEIEKIREACLFADAIFEFLLPLIQPGRTEYDVQLDLEFFIRRHRHSLAFPPIVVSGERSARPHGKASDKPLESGDFLTMDFGANIDGYNSDLTRTVVVGDATPRHREIYEQVLKAEMAALDAIRPGVLAKDVDALARKVLDEKGLAQYFGHGLGHGLGRIVHDTGRMNASSEDVFAPGQVWTVEPGVYIEGFGGVRIEDDVVVTDDGIEILTHAPKQLLELPRR